MFSYNSYPPQFDERSFHHRHGHHGRHAFGGPRGPRAEEFAAFGYADFPEPPMRGFRDGKPHGRHHHHHHHHGFAHFGYGGPHAFAGPQAPQGPPQGPYGPPPHAFGFDGPRGFRHHHRGPPPPPPFAEYGFSGYGGPRGFGRHGPPPFEFGGHPFGCHGPPPPPPPPPFDFESGSSSEEAEKSADEVAGAERSSRDAAPGAVPFGFGPGGRHGRRRHHRGFPGSSFEAFGSRHHGRRHHRHGCPGDMDEEMRSFGFGGRHHGRHGHFGRFTRAMAENGDEDFVSMCKKHRGPARVESRVLESSDMLQVQILRHGSAKGFKHYAITYETKDGEVVLSIDSELDEVHKTFKLKESEVVIADVTWDIIDRCLAVSIPKVQTAAEKEDEIDDVADMIDGATLAEQPKTKKTKKTKKSKSKKASVSTEDKVPPRPSSTETWSSISTPTASEDEAEVGNKVQIKAASKSSREEEPVRFRLPELNNNLASNESESESDSETTDSSSKE